MAVGVAAALVLWVHCSPINDRDALWHVWIGRALAARHTVDVPGGAWLSVPVQHWQTSQWLSELTMFEAVSRWGWLVLVVGRVVILSCVLLLVALTLFSGRPAVIAAPVTILVFLAFFGIAQDRPEMFSFLFLVPLGWACVRLWDQGVHPPYLALALGTLVWAQLHGSWILAPVAFALVAVCRLLDNGARDLATIKVPLICAGACLAGLINPLGFTSFVLPWRFHTSGAFISEWAPTGLTSVFVLAAAVVAALTVAAWARRSERVWPSELLWSLTWWAFALAAYRNVVPALLLTAPACAVAMDRTWGDRIAAAAGPTSRRESRVLAAMVATTLVVATGAIAAKVRATDPLETIPVRRIAAWTAAQPEPLRIFNSADTAGSLIAFGGGNARLVVDGRADLWGGRYLARVIGAQSLAPGWDATLDALHPQAFVIPAATPLATLLEREGWRVEMRDGAYVLLIPGPGAALLPSGRPTAGTGGPLS